MASLIDHGRFGDLQIPNRRSLALAPEKATSRSQSTPNTTGRGPAPVLTITEATNIGPRSCSTVGSTIRFHDYGADREFGYRLPPFVLDGGERNFSN
jgi:hypothetical protein